MIEHLVNSRFTRTYPDPIAEEGADEPVRERKRLPVLARERQIVQAAIHYFSEHGLDATMRELAQGIGMAHTLVYHYFPTKQALVDRVYDEVFIGRWKPEWEHLLDDPHASVPDKFMRFYVDYAKTVLTREFVRILVFSGLTDRTITDRFFELLTTQLFPRLIRETRAFRGVVSRKKTTPREHELLMGLHGGVFYTGLRRYVYGHALSAQGSPSSSASSATADDAQFIVDRIHSYLHTSLGLEPQARTAVAAPARKRISTRKL